MLGHMRNLNRYFSIRPAAVFMAMFLAAFTGLSPLTSGAVPQASAQVATLQRQVTIDDQADILTPEEEEKLSADTQNVSLPDSVKDVYYVTFSSNDDNFNDTMRYYTADHGLHDAAGEKYADGYLCIGVFAGEDVAADLQLHKADGNNGMDMDRINGINQAMKPLLADEKWAEGMLRGVQAAADTDLRVDNSMSKDDGWIMAGIFGFIAAVGTFIIGGVIRQQRRTTLAKAKDDYAYIIEHHGDVAGRLDAINVRAHSLTSPLANDALRKDWDDIHSKFLEAHSAMDQLGELSRNSSDKEFRSRASALANARTAVEQVVNAEANIEELAAMEHGDAASRRAALTDLHQDVLSAVAKAKGEAVGQLKALDQRILDLRDNLDRADFMDVFTDILGDYRTLVEAIQEQLYAESKVKEREHDVATLGSASWRPGIGYYYIPFATVDTWHSEDVSYHQAQTSSSSSSSSYSSGGFSGSGGSSSF